MAPSGKQNRRECEDSAAALYNSAKHFLNHEDPGAAEPQPKQYFTAEDAKFAEFGQD